LHFIASSDVRGVGQNSIDDGRAKDLRKFCKKFLPKRQSQIGRRSTLKLRGSQIKAELGEFVQGN
jgi:hypothetical protein